MDVLRRRDLVGVSKHIPALIDGREHRVIVVQTHMAATSEATMVSWCVRLVIERRFRAPSPNSNTQSPLHAHSIHPADGPRVTTGHRKKVLHRCGGQFVNAQLGASEPWPCYRIRGVSRARAPDVLVFGENGADPLPGGRV